MRVLMTGLMLLAATVASAWAEPRLDTHNLRRVREALTTPAESASPQRLRLDFQVQVVAARPKVRLFDGFDVRPGAPVRHGAPTHGEFLMHWTPTAFRSTLPARVWRR